ncbi:MAG: gliding motility-associated C-terminal domain-containing protein [Flavobacteriales bacterium]|nr:gliding motility-associated C-terminal domain-containing protein [Flavobacteriales bacterium]
MEWNGVTGNNFDPSVGSQTVTYTFVDANGCSNSCTTNITVNALPVVACGGPYPPVCIDAVDVPLNGSPWWNVEWNGVTGNNFDPSVGSQTVTYTFVDANGCSNSCTTNITVNALPVVACGGPYSPVCIDAVDVPLNGSPLGGTWSGTGVTGNNFDPSVGSQTVTYTFVDANGCSNSCTTNITVNALPVVACGGPYPPVCIDAVDVPLNGSPLGGTWSGTGVTGNNFDPSVGSQTVTYTFVDANGCSNSCTTNITVNALPVVACGGPYPPVCIDAVDVPLSGSPLGGTWSGTGVTGNNFDPSVGSQTVTYTFVGANGCSNSCTTNMTVNALPVLVPGNYGPYCASDAPIILGGMPMGGTWTGAGVNAGSFNPAVTGAGTYPLTYSYNDVNGCSQSAQTSLTVFPAPVVDIGGDTTVCPGQSVTFNALTPGATYIWQDNSVGPTFSTSTPMIVTVQVTVNGCTTASSAQLINFNLQSVNLGPDVSVCEGTAVPLSVNVSGATYAWSTTSTANAINANTTDWYWVDVSLNGCSVRDSIYVTIKPNPIVNLGLDRMVCPGATALLNATTPNATYLWSNNAITPTVNAGLGAWSVQVTVDGCPGTDMVNVGNYVAPTVNLGPDTILCPGASLLLNATTPFMSYSWQNASTAATFLVQQAGSFSVTLTDSHGCTGSDLINVGYASPNQVFIGNDTTICSGTMITLDASTPGATLYSWNNGWNSNTLPVAGGLYWVDVVQGNCMVTDSIHIGVAFPPVFSLGNDTTLCPGATLLLDATVAGVNYLWQDNSTLPTLLVSDDGTFSVTLTNADLCAATETITVTYADPDALDLGPDTSICSGTTLTLQATLPGSTYLWNTLAQTSTIDVTDPGSYSVVVMQGGCSVTDDINVLVAPSPFVDLGNDTTLCDASTLTLDAFYPGATYVWTTNEVTSSLTVSSANTYGVTVDLNGCSATDSIEVAYVGALAIDLGNDTTLCPGALLDLFASLPGGTTVWSTNTVGPTITVSQADTLWANVSVSGCSVSDSIIVQYVQLDQLDLGSDASVCEADAMDFDITIPGATYLWDDNSTNPVRSIDEEGDYWARITLGGCETSDTVHITITPLPLVYLGPDTGLCAGSTLLLNASQPGATYLWNNSSTQGTITAVPGEWNVEVTLNGCTAGDSITIASLPTPSLSLPTDTTLCTGSVWIIDVAQPNATYVWQDASTASGFLVDAADNYNVTVSIGGCSAYAEVDVSYFDASLVDLGPDTTLCPGQQLLLSLTLPGVVLTWPNGLHGNDFTVSSSGTYTLLANANGCTASDEINVDYTPLGQPELGDDRTLCEGDSVVLVVVPGSASVLWNSGSTSDSLLTTTSGTYSVSLSLDGCSATDAVEFEFVPVIDSIDLGEDATICLGNTVVLDAFVNRATYDWNTGSNTASINVTSPGLYIVQLAGPCISAIDSVLVIEGNCPSEIFIPNSFTPDGDGLNEVFGPITTGNFKSFTFLIFNRWGENIFSSETPGGSWDGTLNGTMVQDGVYVWQLAYRAVTDVGVEQKRLTGSVTLLR